MVIFQYDKTFEGLLTVVFDAYNRRCYPDIIIGENDPLPLFYDELVRIYSDRDKAERVWTGLGKKLSDSSLSMISIAWLSEINDVDNYLFRYIRKSFDSATSIELNFTDPDVFEILRIAKKVNKERLHIIQFLRFQKASDDTFFAAVEPVYNVLPLILNYLQDRFADQRWLVYDLKREYGYYYDLTFVTDVRFEQKDSHLIDGLLNESMMAEDEKLFRQMWKTYFHAIAIKERINPKLHRQLMPARYWKHITEKL